MKSPFAQPEKSRVANVTIAKSRVLAAQFLRILSDTRKERPILLGVKLAHTSGMRRATSVDRSRSTSKASAGLGSMVIQLIATLSRWCHRELTLLDLM